MTLDSQKSALESLHIANSRASQFLKLVLTFEKFNLHEQFGGHPLISLRTDCAALVLQGTAGNYFPKIKISSILM